MLRFSVRALLATVTLVALAVFAYRSFTTPVVRSRAALQLFGPDYEWDGIRYDRQIAHERLVNQILSDGIAAVPAPAWVSDYPVLGIGNDSNWTPTRSDWFLIQRKGAEACLNLASSDSGFAVVIWVRRKLMWHELDDQANVMAREIELLEQVNDDWQRSIWPDYVSAHQD